MGKHCEEKTAQDRSVILVVASVSARHFAAIATANKEPLKRKIPGRHINRWLQKGDG